LQILYQLDLAGQLRESVDETTIEQALAQFWLSFADSDEPVDRTFAERLVKGVTSQRSGLDAALGAASQNWKLARMASVDRNLLRTAAYEILYCPDIPHRVTINEALEIAKRFSGGQAAAFVNGILDQIAKGAPG